MLAADDEGALHQFRNDGDALRAFQNGVRNAGVGCSGGDVLHGFGGALQFVISCLSLFLSLGLIAQPEAPKLNESSAMASLCVIDAPCVTRPQVGFSFEPYGFRDCLAKLASV